MTTRVGASLVKSCPEGNRHLFGSCTSSLQVIRQPKNRVQCPVGERSVEHEGVTLTECDAWLTHLAAGEVHRVAVAIAVPRGAIVELRVERGFHTLNESYLPTVVSE